MAGVDVVPELQFETTPCGRCGGTGSYSWCQPHGSTCFRCGGRGRHLTKRGASAVAHLRALRSKPASEVRAGDRVWVHGCPGISRGAWRTVTAAGPSQAGRLVTLTYTDIETEGPGVVSVLPDAPVRVAQAPWEQVATHAAALAYQATLGADGKPRPARVKADT